jgi:uncharacterized protein YecT (DUF1311 family)
MLVHSLVLAVAANQCDDGTTYDMRMCWSKQGVAAAGELQSTYDKVRSALRTFHIDATPLAEAQTAWASARDSTCALEYALYVPGTIAPQIALQCDVRMTRARTQRLAAFLRSLETKSARRPEQPASASALAELDCVDRFYREHLTSQQRAALDAAQRSWNRYRAKTCPVEGGSCLTDLAKERVSELKDAWIGEPFC